MPFPPCHALLCEKKNLKPQKVTEHLRSWGSLDTQLLARAQLRVRVTSLLNFLKIKGVGGGNGVLRSSPFCPKIRTVPGKLGSWSPFLRQTLNMYLSNRWMNVSWAPTKFSVWRWPAYAGKGRRVRKAERKVLPPFVNNEESDLPENCIFLVKRKACQNGYLVRKENLKSKVEPWRTSSQGEKQKGRQ